MKHFIVAVAVGLVLFGATASQACVGKTLFIGITGSSQEQLLAELVSVLVTERTGTTVKVVPYKDSRQLYGALKQGQVNLVIENTDRGFDMLGQRREAPGKSAYETLKAEYRKSLHLVWLEPFGFVGTGSTHEFYAPVLSMDTINSLPALPKLLQKLAGVASDASFARLSRSTRGEITAKAARDYLKSRKMI